DLDAMDLDAYASMLVRMAATGAVVRTFEELANDPHRDRKLYDLVWEVRQDLPDLDAPTQEPFDYFVAHRLHNPDLAPGGFLVAVKDGAYVGYIYHFREPDDPGRLFIAQLGVARAYRGQSIAHGLKV